MSPGRLVALNGGPEADAGLGKAQKDIYSRPGRGSSKNPLRREPTPGVRGHSELKKASPLLSWNYTGPEECLADLEWEW